MSNLSSRVVGRYKEAVVSATPEDDDFNFEQFEKHPRFKEFLAKFFHGGKLRVRRLSRNDAQGYVWEPIEKAIQKRPGNSLYRNDFQRAFTRYILLDEPFDPLDYVHLRHLEP